jgi:hypothetical protein
VEPAAFREISINLPVPNGIVALSNESGEFR